MSKPGMSERIWSDEQLTAYLDGEMTEAEARILAADIEADELLAHRFEQQAAANTAFVSSASEIDSRPMPAAVNALLASANASAARNAGAGNVVALKPRGIGGWLVQHRAAAAALIAVAGTFGAYQMVGRSGATESMLPSVGSVIVADSALDRALDAATSAETVNLSNGASLTPRLSFVRDDGVWCRQFDIQGASATASVACQDEAGWRITLSVATHAAGSDYQTASGDRSAALEAYLNASMAGPALGAEQEKAMIANSWKGAAPPAR